MKDEKLELATEDPLYLATSFGTRSPKIINIKITDEQVTKTQKEQLIVGVTQLMVDVRTMVKADLFVGTASSCLSRFVYEQRMSGNPYRNQFDSLLIEMAYLFEDMTFVRYKAVQDQVKDGNFLGIRKGDPISLRIFMVR